MVYALCGCGQALLLWGTIGGTLPFPTGAALYIALLGIAAMVIFALSGRQLESRQVLELLLLTLGGPPGAIAAIVFATLFGAARQVETPDLLEWYDTLAGQGEQFSASLPGLDQAWDDSAILDPDAPTLGDIVRHGSLPRKRNAIAYITSAYHRDYYPLLRFALSDKEPTIRVQAAAVLTGLGQEAREQLDELTGGIDGAGRDAVLPLAEAVTRHITSHLLDADGMRVAVRGMAQLVDRVIRNGSEEDRAEMQMQLVWCCHETAAEDTIILRALLDKLIATQPLERLP